MDGVAAAAAATDDDDDAADGRANETDGRGVALGPIATGAGAGGLGVDDMARGATRGVDVSELAKAVEDSWYGDMKLLA